MAVHGRGALAGWFDYQGKADMNEWQAREHIAERVSLPGFIRGRRFESSGAQPRYFMFYEVDDVDVLASPPYLERLNNPTEWSRLCSAGLFNMTRSACRVTATTGTIDGGQVGTAELRPNSGSEPELRDWVTSVLLRDLVGEPGVYAVHLLEPDTSTSRIETTEKRLRTGPDRVSDWTVVVEGRSGELIERGLNALAVAEQLQGLQVTTVSAWRFYRLSFAANH